MSKNSNIITLEEEYKIFDKLIDRKRKSPKSGPLGWVRIYFDNQLHHEGPNLVVDMGRQYVSQRVFNTITQDGGGTLANDHRGYVLDHFAVGSGGVTFGAGGSFTINGPTACDTHLTEAISLGNTSYLDEPHVYDSGDGIHLNTDAVKAITAGNGGNVVLQSTVCDGGVDEYYTKAKCTCVIDIGEPTNLAAGESVQISEAGLYFTDAVIQSPNPPTDAQLFSRVSFAPKWKEKESEMSIVWYILF